MKSINWLRGRPESWSGTVSNTDSVLLEDYTSTLLIGCWDCQYSWRIIRTTTFLLRIIRATIYHLSAHVSFSNIVTNGAASSVHYITVQYYHHDYDDDDDKYLDSVLRYMPVAWVYLGQEIIRIPPRTRLFHSQWRWSWWWLRWWWDFMMWPICRTMIKIQISQNHIVSQYLHWLQYIQNNFQKYFQMCWSRIRTCNNKIKATHWSCTVLRRCIVMERCIVI